MEYPLYPQPPRRSHRKRNVLIGFLTLLVVAGAIFYFWDSGNKATITPATTAQPKPLPSQTYNGHYMTFIYHGGYEVKSQQLTSTGTETAILRDDTTYEKLLSVRVEPTGGDKLGISDSSYYLRQSHPDLYHGQQVSVAGAPATEWIKNDGSEISVYIPKGNQYAVLAFSISGSNDTSGLPGEVPALLQTFRWK